MAPCLTHAAKAIMSTPAGGAAAAVLQRVAVAVDGTVYALAGPTPLALALESCEAPALVASVPGGNGSGCGGGCLTVVDGVGAAPVLCMKATARGRSRAAAHAAALVRQLLLVLFDFTPSSSGTGSSDHIDTNGGSGGGVLGLRWSPSAAVVAAAWVRAGTLASDPVIPGAMLEARLLPPAPVVGATAATAVALMRLRDFGGFGVPAPAPLAGRPLTDADAPGSRIALYLTHTYALHLLPPSPPSLTTSVVVAHGWAWSGGDDGIASGGDEADAHTLRWFLTADGFVEYYTAPADATATGLLHHTLRAAGIPPPPRPSPAAAAAVPAAPPATHLFPATFVPVHLVGGALRAAVSAATFLLAERASADARARTAVLPPFVDEPADGDCDVTLRLPAATTPDAGVSRPPSPMCCTPVRPSAPPAAATTATTAATDICTPPAYTTSSRTLAATLTPATASASRAAMASWMATSPPPALPADTHVAATPSPVAARRCATDVHRAVADAMAHNAAVLIHLQATLAAVGVSPSHPPPPRPR